MMNGRGVRVSGRLMFTGILVVRSCRAVFKEFGKASSLCVTWMFVECSLIRVLQYMDFFSYAELLSGAHPSVLQNSLVAQHRQTWKLQEYHLWAHTPYRSDSSMGMDINSPLSAGDPIQAHFPSGMTIHECQDGIEFRDPRKTRPSFYRKACHATVPSTTDVTNGDETFVQDVVVIGEVGVCLIICGPRPSDIPYLRDILRGANSTYLVAFDQLMV